MRFSEATGHKVVSTSSARTIAKVRTFVVDPGQQQVVALSLKEADGDRDLLPWSKLTAFGRDAVTVPDDEALTADAGDLADRLGKDHELVGKRVLTEGGDEVGTVDDVEFDDESGAITTVLTDVEGIDGSRLLGVGSYAVVVRNAS